MSDQGPLAEAEVAVRADVETLPHPALGQLQALESRLRRLEDAVAALQEPRPAEVEPRAEAAPEPVATLADTGRRLLPLALTLLRPPPEAGPVAAPAAPKPAWLVVEAYEDLRCIFRMFVDRRYRVRWPAWLIPVGVLFLMLFSWMFLGSIPLIGALLDKTADLVLAFFAYKALVREAQHYRAAVAHWPAAGRP